MDYRTGLDDFASASLAGARNFIGQQGGGGAAGVPVSAWNMFTQPAQQAAASVPQGRAMPDLSGGFNLQNLLAQIGQFERGPDMNKTTQALKPGYEALQALLPQLQQLSLNPEQNPALQASLASQGNQARAEFDRTTAQTLQDRATAGGGLASSRASIAEGVARGMLESGIADNRYKQIAALQQQAMSQLPTAATAMGQQETQQTFYQPAVQAAGLMAMFQGMGGMGGGTAGSVGTAAAPPGPSAGGPSRTTVRRAASTNQTPPAAQSPGMMAAMAAQQTALSRPSVSAGIFTQKGNGGTTSKTASRSATARAQKASSSQSDSLGTVFQYGGGGTSPTNPITIPTEAKAVPAASLFRVPTNASKNTLLTRARSENAAAKQRAASTAAAKAAKSSQLLTAGNFFKKMNPGY